MNSTKKTLALLSTSALAAGAAKGAVIYTPINITLSASGKLALDLNLDGSPDFQLGFNGAPKPFINNVPAGATSSYVLSAASNQGLPLTPAGTLINASYQSAQSSGYFNKKSDGTVVGGWTAAGNNEAYVGLELTDGAETHYGWAHFIFNATGVPANNKDTGTLTLLDAAMETTPGVGILAGQTAETGAPLFAVPPLAQTGYLGGTAELTAIATGFPAPGFQWRAGAVGSGVYTNLPNGAGVSDGTINTLTLQNQKLANMADYVVVATNSHGAITSSPPATLTVLPASDSPATLVHRYSFHDAAGSSVFSDSVGGSTWDGTLNGSATLTGSSLQLDGSSGCYASLPPYITSGYAQMTVEFWVDVGPSNPVWTRIFSFGDGSGGTKNSGIDYCPFAAGNYQNLDLSDYYAVDGYANNNAGLNGATGKHITVVVDSTHGVLGYYNGASVVSTLNTAVPSLANINDVNNLIGASLVASDPYFAGTIREFRIYQGVLPAQAIALNDAVGPANYIQLAANPTIRASRSGGNIVLAWPASDFNFAVQSRAALVGGPGWATLTNAPALVGTNWQVSLPLAAGPQFYQLIH
jgi:hypothetical protein